MTEVSEQPQYYDPMQLTKIVERHVVTGEGGSIRRRYYRFRRDRWYGGIVTGDVVGCNLRCGFCWAWRFTWGRFDVGSFYDAEEVVERLKRLSKGKIKKMRLSGGEPTIGFDHLIKVMELAVAEGFEFVLETNGLLLGYDKQLAKKLAKFRGCGIEVRVSIKGTSPEEFALITGAVPGAWGLQLQALVNLIEQGLEPGEEVYPAVMLSFTDEKGVVRIKRILAGIDSKLAENLDPEYVILYPHVEKLLRARGLKPRKAFKPYEIPPELI